MKLPTAHQRTRDQFGRHVGGYCEQCEVSWPCDAAIACAEIETLNRIINRLLHDWLPVGPVDDEPGLWVCHVPFSEDDEEVMTDREVEVLRPHMGEGW